MITVIVELRDEDAGISGWVKHKHSEEEVASDLPGILERSISPVKAALRQAKAKAAKSEVTTHGG